MGVRVPRPLPPSVSSRRPGQRRRTRAIQQRDRKSTRLNSSHDQISYAVFCLKKKNISNGGTTGNFDIATVGLSFSIVGIFPRPISTEPNAPTKSDEHLPDMIVTTVQPYVSEQ